MTANSDKSKQNNKAAHRVLAGALCGASVLSLVLSLVMPPISQAIANDAQTVSTEETVMGGGSSSESAGVNGATGDTENQNSDDTEGGEADTVDPSSDDDEDENAEQPADDGVNDEDAIAPVAEDADGYTLINSAKDLYDVLQVGKKAGKFRLNVDIEYASDITLTAGEVTIDLNGHKIKHSGVESGKSPNMSMFNVPAGATLTIEDLPPTQDQEYSDSGNKNGNLAKLEYENGTGTPSTLTYYVTKSTPIGTATTEALYRHEVKINGAIVGTTASSEMKLIHVYAGGTFNLKSGVLTTNKDCKVANLIYAENGSTVNMSGGYVCGATSMSKGAGIELGVNGGKGAALNLKGGVIAGNYAPNGGGVYAYGSTINMTGGTISGNGTFEDRAGYGAGICALGSSVSISGGYITNNNCQFDYRNNNAFDAHNGNGCHGGGGIAAYDGGSLEISGGYITGNYSAEAGGGVYAGYFHQPLSIFTFSGGTIANNVAKNSEGGGVRIAAPTIGKFDVSGQKAYITNNETLTTNDWGGGGIFVQGGGTWKDGNSETPVASAKLYIYSTLIKDNSAQGYGGGFAACPSGKTAITDTNGIAIFDNTDKSGENLSGGTNGKNEDQPTSVQGGEITEEFKNAGHKDLFLIRASSNSDYIAAVTGQMLGGGAANWSGTIDKTPTSIGKYEGAQAKYMIGLAASPSDADKDAATGAATLFITGNSSNIHGGGIMTNGDVIAGSTMRVSVYPKMKLSGTKKLEGRNLEEGEFEFQLLKPAKSGKAPSFDKDGKLQLNDCSKVVDGVTNDADGNFAFNLGRVYSDGSIVYYLVEDPGDNPVAGVVYDRTIYKIEFETNEAETRQVLDIAYTYYAVTKVTVTDLKKNESNTIAPSGGSDVSIEITQDTTFKNTYSAEGSWTPQVTKKVDGGEMKSFKFELFTKDGSKENPIEYKWTTDDPKSSQLVTFANQKIGPLKASDFTNGKATFTYYIRECAANKGDGTEHEGYVNDTKTFKVVVTAEDKGDGTLTCTPAYYEVDANGNVSSTSTDTPTFTNTYSTSLPLSGMSGVTLTYLAGAAVLCAAAAWMHIRRKANAKGGERRE